MRLRHTHGTRAGFVHAPNLQATQDSNPCRPQDGAFAFKAEYLEGPLTVCLYTGPVHENTCFTISVKIFGWGVPTVVQGVKDPTVSLRQR